MRMGNVYVISTYCFGGTENLLCVSFLGVKCRSYTWYFLITLQTVSCCEIWKISVAIILMNAC